MSLRPHYVFIGLTHLSQIHGTVLQLVDCLFSHCHVALYIARGTTLQSKIKIFRHNTMTENILHVPAQHFNLNICNLKRKEAVFYSLL